MMLHLALMLTIASPASGVELAAVRRGDVTATARVRVAEQGAGPGRGRVAFTITVTGPPALEVEGPRLEDALAAWRVAREASSWSGGQTATVEITLGLVQVKPGAAPLPGVRLRVRGGPGEGWQDVSWLDPLHEAREVAPIVELPPLPPAAWRRRALVGAIFAIPLLAVGGFAWWRARRRGIPVPPQPAWRRALAGLSEGAGVEQVTRVVRGFLQEQAGLPASRLTTGELMALLQARGDLTAEALARLRRLLDLGDLVKFAGRVPTATEASEALRGGRELVEALATWPAGETGAVGKAG